MIYLLMILIAAVALPQSGVDWPSFRGPQARGFNEGGPTATRWNVETGEGVRWKTPIPGLGHSSPIIWGDRIFVTSAVSSGERSDLKVGLYGDITPVQDDSRHSWSLYCLDKNTGRILWERTVHEGVPRIKRHPKSTHANSTPATDGRYVVSFFGSEGLYCYDFDGNLIWEKDLGLLDSGYFQVPSAHWGFASSPVIHQDRVVVQCDVLSQSFVAAFDLKNGKEIWRRPRSDVPTWSTPTIHRSSRGTEVIVNGFREIAGYDFHTGKRLWHLQGGGDIPVPTPVVGHGLIFITNAHGGRAPIYAIRGGASGTITPPEGQTTAEHIAWSQLRDGAYMQTPLVYGDYLYICKDNGVLSCFRAATGERLYQQRLGRGGGFSASSVAADGKLYFTSEDGDVYVVRAGPQFELLAVNRMGEICMATPALSEGVLFFRTRSHLVAIR